MNELGVGGFDGDFVFYGVVEWSMVISFWRLRVGFLEESVWCLFRVDSLI